MLVFRVKCIVYRGSQTTDIASAHPTFSSSVFRRFTQPSYNKKFREKSSHTGLHTVQFSVIVGSPETRTRRFFVLLRVQCELRTQHPSTSITAPTLRMPVRMDPRPVKSAHLAIPCVEFGSEKTNRKLLTRSPASEHGWLTFSPSSMHRH